MGSARFDIAVTELRNALTSEVVQSLSHRNRSGKSDGLVLILPGRCPIPLTTTAFLVLNFRLRCIIMTCRNTSNQPPRRTTHNRFTVTYSCKRHKLLFHSLFKGLCEAASKTR